MKLLKVALYIILILVVSVIAIERYFHYQDSYLSTQVKAVPLAGDGGFLLSVADHISLTPRPREIFSFPVNLGEVGPSASLFSGSKQYPFFCLTQQSGLGQPLVDNDKGYGVPVYREDFQGNITETIVGYSMDCGLRTRISYYYRHLDTNKLRRYFPSNPPANDSILKLRVNAQQIPEIYRVEQGTINRFIYSIMMLVEPTSGRLDARYWNKKLIYYFRGGSGIGFRQGKAKLSYLDRDLRPQLQQGYAVITSTGNSTSNTYNMLLAEDTARRVKLQFVTLYGEPLYTIGLGGSGGGLAQYLLAQNGAQIIDAAIPVYAYPDMVSQTIHLFDCDLLNNYYALRSLDPKRFQDWSLRREIEGMNALNGVAQRVKFLEPLNQILTGRWPVWPEGNSECINGWTAMSSYIHNPRQGFLRAYFSRDIVKTVHWNYWEDMQSLFGRDSTGFVPSTWDNEGVQYGLQALLKKRISVAEFLHLNRFVGGWRPLIEMKAERLWAPWGKKLPLWLTLWGRHNITEPKQNLAARHRGDLGVIERAYRTGQVFIGKIDIPVLDIRHYLEEKLNMHHISASFAARARIIELEGTADNQLIWVAHKNFNLLDHAISQMDLWMQNILKNPELDIVAAKPVALQDSCFAADESIVASGADVWDGVWNGKPDGVCSRHFPAFSNARIVAGAPWRGSIFKCHLQSLQSAIDSGVYGDIDMRAGFAELEEIFPTGVCDYSLGDAGRPSMFESRYP